MVLDGGEIPDDTDGVGGGGGGEGKELATVSCSICMEPVTDNGDRSWAKLQCGHQFHLDCIGSAFNCKGAMQCPNCRMIQKGQWLYATGCRQQPEFGMDDVSHDEDVFDFTYEMSVGFHWCPFSGVTRVPSSYEEGEYSSTTYIGQHAVLAEHAAISSASHPCPYIAYLGPVHPSSSNSNASASDGSNFNNPWNGASVPNEITASYAFPSMEVQYHGWDHHSSPFSAASSRISGADQPSMPSVAQRAVRTNSDVSRSGSFLHPLVVGHSSAARAGSSVVSSTIPPYPGSVARGRDRVQALQRYFHQLSNTPSIRNPAMPGSRRSSAHRSVAQVGPVASSSEQAGGFYFIPSSSSGRTYQEAENPLPNRFHGWDREHLSSFPSSQINRDSGWGPFHQAAGVSDGSLRTNNYRQRHGMPERMPSQNRS